MAGKKYKPSWAVNYGVNHSHRAMNSHVKHTYREALKVYEEIDREKWPVGEIVRMEFDEHGLVCRKDRRKAYDAHGERRMTEEDQNLPVHIV